MKTLFKLAFFVFVPFFGLAQTTYTWNGTTSDWQLSTNWTPSRTPASNDILVFDATATVKVITDIASQSVGKIQISGSSTYSFESASSQVISLTSTTGNAFEIQNGSSLSVGSASFPLGITLPASGAASVGGKLNLINGSFSVGNGTLILHTDPAPLTRVSGQVTMSSGSILQFGISGVAETTARIVLPSPIFSGSLSIASIVVNRANGAELNNQVINLSSGITFTRGDLVVPNSGTLIFGTTATDPTLSESSNSKIVGYAEMLSRVISTGAIDFLGFQMAGGTDNLNNIVIKRRTGTPAVFNAIPSIAVYWTISTGFEPISGRAINFKWLSSFDGIYNPTIQFRTFINNGAPGWNELPPQQLLASSGDPRISQSVNTTLFGNHDLTLTDQSATLPVELTSFNVMASATRIKLVWQTSSEKNNESFFVEKLGRDNMFRPIGKLPGAGTTLVRHNYSFEDEKPFVGDNYYRLKQVDIDGAFSYSKVVSSFFDGRSISGHAVYPNPADGKVIYFENMEEEFDAYLSDFSGTSLFQFSLSSEHPFVDLSELKLKSGLYLIQTRDKKGSSSFQRLVVK